jgi:prepilin peptidase CpaA
MLVHLAFCMLLLCAACHDINAFRIPNWISIALVVLFFVNGLSQYQSLTWSIHLLAGVLTLIGGFCLFSAGIMGAGDVKLIAATSLWLGLPLLPHFLVIMAIAGLGTAIVLILIRRLNLEKRFPACRWLPASFIARSRVPYGVAIALASLFASNRLPESIWLV